MIKFLIKSTTYALSIISVVFTFVPQYLTKYPIPDIKRLIDDAQLNPAKTKSKYQGKERYESGKLVPNGEDLLMAFAQLAKEGKGMFRSFCACT